MQGYSYESYAAKAAGVDEKDKLELQREVLLPLIKEEKKAFVGAEFGRLQQIMGCEYTQGEEQFVFHPVPGQTDGGERVLGDPAELSLRELAVLPHLTHKVYRLGTVSYMPLIQCYPQDVRRLELLAGAYETLMSGYVCGEHEVKELLNGHSEYMSFKAEGEVRVIK